MKDKYSLNEIASWVEDNSDVEIPALQRGLVWKPNQVELLWDSILRGFPIGSFMLSETDKQQNSYYLMDGQQRFNAIAIGYNRIKEEHPASILWIDINPKQEENSNRVYNIKVTTMAHPWGYKNDGNILSAPERRKALEKYKLDDTNIYNTTIDLKETWPYFAECPIPLFIFLHAIENLEQDSEELFFHNISEEIEKHKDKFKYLEQIHINDIEELVKELYKPFKRLKNYYVSVNVLSRDVIDNESERTSNDSETTTLETLFTRLNTGGTRISQEDLSYSAIKAYWPEIKDINDAIALEYMSPEKLAILVFRLALTLEENNNKKISGSISIQKIRILSSSDNTKQNIKELYDNKLKDILSKIDTWLNVSDMPDATPKFLRTSIARNSPDVFLLLMYLACRYPEAKSEDMQGLAFYLHWFANKQKECVDLIYRRCNQYGYSMSVIDNALYDSLNRGYLFYPYYFAEDISNFITIKDHKDWRPWSDNTDKPWWDFWNLFVNQKECLLYAEREYLNFHFKLYNPARNDMWEKYNRPWDYDHIIPQEWMYKKRAEYLHYCQAWQNYNGNMAAISFEKNRSKNNRDDYKEYDENQSSLLFNPEVKNIGKDVAYYQNLAVKFAEITYSRSCQICEECSKLWKVLFKSKLSNGRLNERKQLFESISSKIEGFKNHFVYGDKDFCFKSELDWCREWISTGIIIGDYYICLSAKAPETEHIVEIGIRKCPTKAKIEEKLFLNNDMLQEYKLEGYQVYNEAWWYVEKDTDLSTSKDQLIEELNKLYELAQKNRHRLQNTIQIH